MKYLLKQVGILMIFLVVDYIAFAQTLSYVGLYPGDSSRIIFQIKPDKNYTNVIAYIRFYSTGNKLLSSNGGDRIMITSNENKWIKKGTINSKILSHHYKNVGYIKLNRFGEEEMVSSDDKADDLGSIKKIKFKTAEKPLKPL